MTNEEAMILALGVLAFAAVVVLVPLVRRVALAYGVTDMPQQGKLHSSATPYLGGIAVALAILGSSAFLPAWSEQAAAVLVGALLAAIALKLRFVVQPPASVVAVGLLVGPAVFDTTLVVVSRVRAKRPIHVGGTDHTSHRLLILGLGCRSVGAVLALGTAACAALGLAVGRGALPAAEVAVLVMMAGGTALVALLRVPVYESGAGRVVLASAPVGGSGAQG